MQKNMQKKCTKKPEQKCQNEKKGKKISKKEYVKGWNNGSALVLKLEGHGFKSLFRAFVFSS